MNRKKDRTRARRKARQKQQRRANKKLYARWDQEKLQRMKFPTFAGFDRGAPGGDVSVYQYMKDGKLRFGIRPTVQNIKI